jgi:hypothetical protein
MSLQPGQFILNSRYRLEALIGADVFAQVYRALKIPRRYLREIQ